MEDIGSLIIVLAIIYSAIIIFTILLLNKLYKAEFVLGTMKKKLYSK